MDHKSRRMTLLRWILNGLLQVTSSSITTRCATVKVYFPLPISSLFHSTLSLFPSSPLPSLSLFTLAPAECIHPLLAFTNLRLLGLDLVLKGINCSIATNEKVRSQGRGERGEGRGERGEGRGERRGMKEQEQKQE